MRLWHKKSLYIVKRKIIVAIYDVDEETLELKVRESEVELSDGIYFKTSDCKLIFTLIREASKLREHLPECQLVYKEMRGSENGAIDWRQTLHNHFSLHHGLFVSSCPQTH